MKKTFAKLFLTGLFCALLWQMNSIEPVHAEEQFITYAQSEQVDKSKVTGLILPKDCALCLTIAYFRTIPADTYNPPQEGHEHSRNPLYQYPNLKKVLVEPGNSDIECRDGIIYSGKSSKEGRTLECVPMAYEGVVHIAKDVVNISSPAFDQCDKISAYEVEEGNPKYYSQDGILYENGGGVGKDTLVSYPSAKKDESFTFPSEISYMKTAAFAYNRYLKEVTLHEEINYIGAAAFEKCTSLERINNISDEMKEICSCAFEGCEKFQLFDMPKGLKKIGPYAFAGTSAVKKVVFPTKCESVIKTGLKIAEGGIIEAKGPWLFLDGANLAHEGNFTYKGYKETRVYKEMKKLSYVTCEPYAKQLYKHANKKIHKGVKGKGKPKTSWYKKKKKVLYIKNPDQLAGIQKLLKKGITFKGKKVILKNSLDMSCYKNFVPLGYDLVLREQFEGVFDGKGKTIYNLSIHQYENQRVGLFSILRGTVKNLKLKGANVYGRYYVGGIAGNLSGGKIENCKVSGVVKGINYVNKIGAYFWDFDYY